MIITRQVELTAIDDNRKALFSRIDKKSKFSMGEGGIENFKIAQPFVDQDLMAGSSVVTGRILYIETDAIITVKLDVAGDTGFVVKPIDTESPGVLYLEGSFTHVYVSGAAAVDANITMGLVGE